MAHDPSFPAFTLDRDGGLPLGTQLGWYKQNEGAGFLAAILGAIIILFIWRLIAGRR